MLRECDFFQRTHAQGPAGRVLGQVTVKGKTLAVQAARRQSEHDRHRPDHWHHLQAQCMRGPYHGRARVGDGRHAGLADQARVVAGQCVVQQGPRVEVKLVIALLVQFTRQLAQAQLLERGHQ